MLHVLLAAVLAAPTDTLPGLSYELSIESAERIDETVEDAAPSATVIGPAEIRASGLTQVADLLRRVAGVDINRSGSLGKATTVRLDGASSGQTLVMIDGVTINSPTLGLADLSDLSLDNVERIEIVRGPSSVLYGSSAMGGTINIVTRRGHGRPGLEGEFSGGGLGGALGTMRGRLGSSGAVHDRLTYAVAVSRTEADGRRYQTALGPLEHDAYAATSVSAGLVATLTTATTLSLDLRFTDAERDLPIEVFGAQVFDVNSRQEDRQLVVAARFRTRLHDRVEPFAHVGITDARQDLSDPVDPGESGPFASDFSARIDTRLTDLGAGFDLRLGRGHRLILGWAQDAREGRNRDNFAGDVPNFDDTITTDRLYAQDRMELGSLLEDGDSLVVTGGLSADFNDGYDRTVNPRLSGRYATADGNFRVRAAAGRGFRAPSLNELLFPFFGNPNLEPEVSRTYEVGIGGRALGARLDVEARLFRTDYDDLIGTDPTTFTAVNLDRARVTGLGIEVNGRPQDDWWVRGSYTFQDTEDRTTGEQLVRRPRHKGALTVAHERSERYRLALDLIATGSQRDLQVVGFPQDNEGWLRVDLTGAWTPPFGSRRLELFARVENLLDKEYQEVTAFPAPGIHGFYGVRFRL